MNEKAKIEKDYVKADEKFVGYVMLYADSDAGHLFLESAHTNKISKDFAMNLFKKGLMIVTLESKIYRPIMCEESSGAALVTMSDGTGTAKTAYSEEHGA